MKISKSQEISEEPTHTSKKATKVANKQYWNQHVNNPKRLSLTDQLNQIFNNAEESSSQPDNQSTLDKIRLRIKLKKEGKMYQSPVQQNVPQPNTAYHMKHSIEPRATLSIEPPVKKPRLQSNSQSSKKVVCRIKNDKFVSQPVNELQYITTYNHDHNLEK